MGFWELFLIAVGLSMDAFAVAICKGLSVRGGVMRTQPFVVGGWFGGFQALMPIIGWALGALFADAITTLDHWVAFILLAIIGGKMVYESFKKGEEEDDCGCEALFSPAQMLPLALATSIDALAVGLSFAFLKVSILPAAAMIGVVTFLISALGVKVGSVFGLRFKAGAERAGGVILVCIGLKILLEHTGLAFWA